MHFTTNVFVVSAVGLCTDTLFRAKAHIPHLPGAGDTQLPPSWVQTQGAGTCLSQGYSPSQGGTHHQGLTGDFKAQPHCLILGQL